LILGLILSENLLPPPPPLAMFSQRINIHRE
jgi:hypothetical protein